MLTTSQQQIIAQIESEFSRMNNLESLDYVALFDSKLNELDTWKKEMDIQTKHSQSIAADKMKSIISVFESVCEKHGFELSSYKNSNCDSWTYTIKMNGYTTCSLNGNQYTPDVSFKIMMDFKFTNNYYHLASSDLVFIGFDANFSPLRHNDPDAFIKQVFDKIIHTTKFSKKVN